MLQRVKLNQLPRACLLGWARSGILFTYSRQTPLESCFIPLDANDQRRLASWNFIKDYQKNEDDLHALATGAYVAARMVLKDKAQANLIQPDDCVEIFKGMLVNSAIFTGMLARKPHLLPKHYLVMRSALASYILHKGWDRIKV